MKTTSAAEKTHIYSIGAGAFVSRAAIGSETAAHIEPSDTLRVDRLTAKNTAMMIANTTAPS